jgi:arsenate reductase
MKNNTIFYLPNCGTCKRILETLKPGKEVVLRDIKSSSITEAEIDGMKNLAGSYEALFSRVAMKYRQLGLDKMELKEADYRRLILEEYTFLKRPTMVINGQIFVGSAKKSVEGAAAALGKKA